jgi:hypothetical protein
MAQVIPPRNDMNAFYQNGPSVNLFGYTPYPFETVAAAAAAAQAAVIAVVAIMLCGIAHMEAWHDHHNILNLNEGDIQNNVVAYTPASCQTGTSKPQSTEPAFLYSVLKTKTDPPPPTNFYRPGSNVDIYRQDSHTLNPNNVAAYNAWLNQFDAELRERYLICSVSLNKTGADSKIQQCFTANGIDADIFICRDVAYGNVAYDIRRWAGNTTVYNVQTASGVYDPGPSVSYLSEAGIKCGYQDIGGANGVAAPGGTAAPNPANGRSRYGIFNDSIANENTTVYPEFGIAVAPAGIMVSPEEMMYSRFRSKLFGENSANKLYTNAPQPGAALQLTIPQAKSIIDSSQVNLVVEYGQTPQGQERLYLVTKHSSSKATSMLNLPFICSCIKYSAAVDAIDIASTSYHFQDYLIVNQSGPLKIMTKKFGDSGIALQTLRNEFDFYSFEPIAGAVNLVPRKSNGIHCFMSYDQVAIGSALEYGCPVVIYNVNEAGGVAGGVLLFISKKIQNKFSNPDNIRIELNYKITMALASVDQQAIQTQYAAAVGTPDVPGLWNNPTNPTSVPSITATLGILQTNMNTMQTTLSGWNSSGQNAQFDIWYQNYLRLGSIIAKHTSRLKGVVKLRDIFETNYAQIITTGTAANTIATSAVITDYANNGNNADVIAAAAAAAIAIDNGNVAADAADAAADAAAVINGNDVNLNTAFVNAVAAAAASIDVEDLNLNSKVSNVILTVILEKINAVIQLTSQINKITDTLKIINNELIMEMGAIIYDPNNEDMIKSFNKKVKFTHDKILDRCNPFMGLGKAQRGRSFVNKLTSCNGTDPNAVELGLVIIKQCFDNLNDDLYLDQFQIEIKNLFNTFYNVANIKGLKPNYKLALTGIPDDYKDKFMGQPLLDQYNNNIDPMTFGGREAVQEPITTNLLETKAHAVELKTQKQEAAQASVPIAEELTKQEAAQASVPTAEELTKREAATAEEFKKQKEKMKELLSKVDASITIMTDGTKPKMVDAKTLQDKAKESITLAIKENSYAELSDAQIATYERADSMVKGLDALKNILEMVQKFIQVEGTKYIEHSNKPDSYEFLQARMCLYQVFFVSSFLQTLHQYQTTKTTKKQIKDGKSEKTDGKSGGGERSNIQIGGLGLDRQAAFIAQFKMIAADNGRLPVLQDFTNDLFTFDMKATQGMFECKQNVQGILSDNPLSIVYFRIWLPDNSRDNLWNFSMHNSPTGGHNLSLSERPNQSKYEWDAVQVADWFNKTFIFAYGYVMTMTDYDAIINPMVKTEIDTESTKLEDDDILEATILPPQVRNDQGTTEELDIINTTPDEGGDILEMIFGEENSPKYSSSLAGNGGLYRYIAILANATQDIREHVLVTGPAGFSVVPTIIGERSWLVGQDIIGIEYHLRGFLSAGGGATPAQFDTSNLVQQEVVGGKKKTKRTKKRRNQKKHTKKMKFRKAPKSKKHRKTKRKGK